MARRELSVLPTAARQLPHHVHRHHSGGARVGCRGVGLYVDRVDTTNRGHEEIADLILSEMEDRTVGAK